ncbi:mitochondrial phosphate carrier protein 1, mitochondrial-like [Macadamia integrifolia]|uniref:mitochondrial phosphate carrier protein 1, mitochondrial-like n=1 Tax=Macadamia integrifolia TaxID=60698 RepID=UPI001C4E895B|nr:mitochondrial phosphate carrier protein 1, mitochondrial-like [Macadamia integrifolia]
MLRSIQRWLIVAQKTSLPTVSQIEGLENVISIQMHSLSKGRMGLVLGQYFKELYSDVFPDQNRSLIYFISSASSQVFADEALCPFEAIKFHVQTQLNFAKGLGDGFPKFYATEGLSGPASGDLKSQFKEVN